MSLIGRKQTPEHIRKRTEAMLKTRSLWTDEQKAQAIEKNRIGHLGKITWQTGKKCPQLSGENHWNWGNKMSQQSIEKMRQSLTGRKQSPELVKKRVDARAGYKHSPDTKAKIGMANKGENNGMWEGGISHEQYPAGFWQKNFRESIRIRDSRKCQICGSEENGKGLDIHHIDYNKRNIDSLNLVSLCHKCHGKTNYNRDKGQTFFEEQRDGLKVATNQPNRGE